MNKPIKPNITIPQSFAENGVKTDFDDTLLADGFDDLRPDVLAGDNLNKFIDDTYKGLNYGMAAADAINLINEGETLTVVDGKLTSGASGGGLEIGDIGFTQMAIDESKGKRRAINKLNNIIIQEQYPELTKRIKATQLLDPDLFCTEEEWQIELTASPNGVCYKYVIDDEAGTIRLPKFPDYLDVSINGAKTVSVYGTGKSLGLTNGSANGALLGNSNGTWVWSNQYGSSVGTSISGTGNMNLAGKTFGVVQDSTHSGITGSVDVESEQIKGTYFIQVATGAETEDNIINEIELNNPFSLLDYKYSEYELNNLSWLRSEGQYNSKAIYPAVYDLLLKIYNGTETKAGVSVKLTTETFTDYDFVLNTAEETFRLPIKVKQNFYNALNGDFPVVGTGIALGLTNGSTNYGAMGDNGNGGVMLATNVYGESVGKNATITAGNDTALGVVTNAAKSGLIAKISQTEVSDLYLYFYVGETVQNANLINAGRIEEHLHSLIPDNASLIAGYGMPDYSAQIILDSGTGEKTYVAPSKGWLGYNFMMSGNVTGYVKVNGIQVITNRAAGGDWYDSVSGLIPVDSGDVIEYYTNTEGSDRYRLFNFYPMKGAN